MGLIQLFTDSLSDIFSYGEDIKNKWTDSVEIFSGEYFYKKYDNTMRRWYKDHTDVEYEMFLYKKDVIQLHNICKYYYSGVKEVENLARHKKNINLMNSLILATRGKISRLDETFNCNYYDFNHDQWWYDYIIHRIKLFGVDDIRWLTLPRKDIINIVDGMEKSWCERHKLCYEDVRNKRKAYMIDNGYDIKIYFLGDEL